MLTHVDPLNLMSKLPLKSSSLQALLKAIQISSVLRSSSIFFLVRYSLYYVNM